MDITITSKTERDYFLIESKGVLKSKEDLCEHAEIIYKEISDHGAKKILIYEPETQFPLGLFTYFDVVHFYLDSLPFEIRFLKIAIVIAKEYKEIADFWETVCVNRGLKYYAFTSFQEAHNWLIN